MDYWSGPRGTYSYSIAHCPLRVSWATGVDFGGLTAILKRVGFSEYPGLLEWTLGEKQLFYSKLSSWSILDYWSGPRGTNSYSIACCPLGSIMDYWSGLWGTNSYSLVPCPLGVSPWGTNSYSIASCPLGVSWTTGVELGRLTAIL